MKDESVSLPVADAPTRNRTRLLVALLTVAAALLLAALVFLVQRSGEERDAALARTQHSFAVVLVANEAQGALARAEAALGRYVIDGDPRTGTIYYDEWRHAGHLLDDLSSLVGDRPAEAARMRALRILYARRGVELALPAARSNYKQGWAALSLFAAAGKSPALPAINRILQAVADAEDARLNRRASLAADRTDRSNDLTQLLSLAGVLLALSVVALAWLMTSALAERRIAGEMAQLETERADALERAVTARTAELRDANRRLVEEAGTRAEAEAKLAQMQKMDAVGRLTGGIAHDFNNMLAVVLGGLEMAKRRVTEQAAEATRHIDSALDGAERAAALTRRLLSFARAEPLLPAAAAPGRLLHGMSDLLDRTIGERIAVRIEASTDLWPVWIDAYQLENAVLNLAVNARDAMAGAGNLVMSAVNVRLRAGDVGSLTPGDYVRVAVRDDGAGMSPDTLRRVFEPFFTTKPAGQGTGLGLSQILGFSRQSGGDVTIESVEGNGTTVAIYLPRYADQPQPAEARPLRAATAWAGPPPARPTGAVLVVEDDPRVRAASIAALSELGWPVIACGSGEEALRRLENADVALVMTDVVMPGMTGPELVQAVRLRRPDLPVLFVTGYVGEAGEAESFRGSAVLRKPFTLRALADALTELTMDAPSECAA